MSDVIVCAMYVCMVQYGLACICMGVYCVGIPSCLLDMCICVLYCLYACVDILLLVRRYVASRRLAALYLCMSSHITYFLFFYIV